MSHNSKSLKEKVIMSTAITKINIDTRYQEINTINSTLPDSETNYTTKVLAYSHDAMLRLNTVISSLVIDVNLLLPLFQQTQRNSILGDAVLASINMICDKANHLEIETRNSFSAIAIDDEINHQSIYKAQIQKSIGGFENNLNNLVLQKASLMSVYTDKVKDVNDFLPFLDEVTERINKEISRLNDFLEKLNELLSLILKIKELITMIITVIKTLMEIIKRFDVYRVKGSSSDGLVNLVNELKDYLNGFLNT